MVGKAALYFQNHFKNWSKFIRMFSFKSTSGSFDETMLFTIVVSASRRSSLILLVIELTKEQRGCNSSLSRKQFDAGKRARKDLMRDILKSKNRWVNSLWIVSMISKYDDFKFKLSLSLCFVMNDVLSESRWNWLFSLVQGGCSFAYLEGGVTVACLHYTLSTEYALAAFYADLC